MATLGGNVLTLLDWSKRKDPDGKIPLIAELLSQTNEILDDMLWKEGNLETGHRLTVRTGLPTPAWRLLNRGVAATKSTTAQIDEGIGMLEDWSEIDKDLAQLNGNVNELRLSEATAHIEGINQEMASTTFYGNSGTAPEEFTGLAVRYSDLSANNAQNVLDAGGTGSDNTSVWLVGWGSETVFGIFPKGSQAGLMHEDLGLQTIQVNTGIGTERLRAYQDHWQWKAGIAVKDWRYVVRIANVDVSNLVSKSGAADLTELMIKATKRIPAMAMAQRPAFYMNRSVEEALDIQRRDDVISGGSLVYKDVDGKEVPSFRRVPIRMVDALVNNEGRVT